MAAALILGRRRAVEKDRGVAILDALLRGVNSEVVGRRAANMLYCATVEALKRQFRNEILQFQPETLTDSIDDLQSIWR